MKTITQIIWLLALIMIGCTKTGMRELKQQFPKSVTIHIKSENPLALADAPVTLSIAKIKQQAPTFNPDAYVVIANGQEIASQVFDKNRDGIADEICCVVNIPANQTIALTVRYAESGKQPRTYKKRTQAELSHKVGGKFVDRKYIGGEFQNVDVLHVPPEHTDHSFDIRYEGPGWESDKVGYRFYLDWRNAIDIFGKKTTDMVLQNVGLDGFDSYHEMSDWGADVFKVGDTFGIGTFGIWYQDRGNRVTKTDSITCMIVANGPVYSQIHTIYYGWQAGTNKVDLTADLSIWAGSRLTHCVLSTNGAMDNFCTGLAKAEHTEFFKLLPEHPDEWGYVALWGKQSLASDDDLLGIAVLFQGKQLQELTEDQLNQIVVLKADDDKADYYFLAAWGQEPGGIQTQDAFHEYLKQTVIGLNHPIKIIM
ncbi:DUF4861 domain-containing protein [candidate division KSB1 bacterium]|nr:DUF4861 domain-containing protein [candidate division KSB1 bacterium]